INCGDPPPGLESSGTASSGTTYTDTADYICNEGFVRQSGNLQISCLVTGNWDIANILVCEVVNCGDPPPGLESTGTASSGTTYTDTADYICNEGFVRQSGNLQISCLVTGKWDIANILVCEATFSYKKLLAKPCLKDIYKSEIR
ncbi:hypothetical protein LOTGIDRAFT_176906, partial [Lottia gigantea]